jgi:hypothetical protein
MENKLTKEELDRAKELQKYENKWVALVDGKVAVFGESVKEVAEKAEKMRLTKYSFFLVPRSSAIFAPATL